MASRGKATWWALSDEVLSAMLKRAHAGEEPDTLRLELFANADAEAVD